MDATTGHDLRADHDLQHEQRLLDLALQCAAAGSLLGAAFTVTTTPAAAAMPGGSFVTLFSLTGLMAATSGLVLAGCAYLALRQVRGALDGGVGRAMAILLFVLASLVAPWARLAVVFPRCVELAFAVSAVVAMALLFAGGYALGGSNRIARVFAVLDVFLYGAIAGALLAAGHPALLAGGAAGVALWALVLGGGVSRALVGSRASSARLLVVAALLAGSAAVAPEPHRERPAAVRTICTPCGHCE